MSAHPSPDGSPVGTTTEGQGTTPGEVLAMRMIYKRQKLQLQKPKLLLKLLQQ
jgi:hypothetical protein